LDGLTIKQEFDATIDLIKKFYAITNNLEVLWFAYTPYPGTPLFDISKKHYRKYYNQ